jgi:K+-transporting ATPase ATPase A chain
MIPLRDFAQVLVYLCSIIVLTPVLGRYLKIVLSGERSFLTAVLGGLESLLYSLIGVSPKEEMNWKCYTGALLVFNVFGFVVLLVLQMTQHGLPLNPEHVPNVPADLAFNTAASFVTNTNWQSYAGETTMSYLTQMLGLAVQNFLSAATGIAVLLALIRGLTRRSTDRVGNFWVDLVRSTLYVLLPLSILWAVLLASQGSVQNFSAYARVTTVEGATQTIPQGPAASQIAIKQLGTNGGGFFGANSAFPYENPTPISNFFEMLAILLIPSALAYAYGAMVGSRRQGWVLWGCMMTLFILGLAISLRAEYLFNPSLHASPVMEGKEVRFGVANSVLWSVATTAASNGSVIAMHDSLSPLGGLVALLNIMLGEVIFGGVGAGLYGMIIFVILTVFIAGLMVGRTPEYLGKKIEAFEIKMAAIAVLAPSAVILMFSALAAATRVGVTAVTNQGPHGLTQILYAFSSAAGNNGSAFAGLATDTVFYNVTMGIGMLIGRFAVLVPVLAIAGSLAKKKITPLSSGTFRTDTPLFAFLLISVILIVGALTFFPALSLGPIVEHLLMVQGVTF